MATARAIVDMIASPSTGWTGYHLLPMLASLGVQTRSCAFRNSRSLTESDCQGGDIGSRNFSAWIGRPESPNGNSLRAASRENRSMNAGPLVQVGSEPACELSLMLC